MCVYARPTPYCVWRQLLPGVVVLVVLLLFLATISATRAQNGPGSNTQPFAFGTDQTIIDLNKLVWGPLTAEGVPAGCEIAVLRGDGKTGVLEAMVRLPANFTFPNHSHTSDELYVWIKGDFTYIAADGTATPLSGQTYISLPGGVPHALASGLNRAYFTCAIRGLSICISTPCRHPSPRYRYM